MNEPVFAWGGAGVVVQLFRGDAIEVMAALPDCTVDAVVTDPPYEERNAAWDRPRGREWWVEWIRQASRLVVPGGPIVSFCSRRRIDVVMGALREVRGDSSEVPLQSGIWRHGQGFVTGDGLLRPEHEPWIASGRLRTQADDVRRTRRYEVRPKDNSANHHLDGIKPTSKPLVVSRKETSGRGFGPIDWEFHKAGPMAGTVFSLGRSFQNRTDHPTEKPEALMAYLVALAAPPGGTVLDPFAGSGTTGVVAQRLGRSAMLIEREEQYCTMIATRLESESWPLYGSAE